MAFTAQQEADLLALLNRGTKKMRDLPEQTTYDSTLFARVLDEDAVQLSQRDRKMSLSLIGFNPTEIVNENIDIASSNWHEISNFIWPEEGWVIVQIDYASTPQLGPLFLHTPTIRSRGVGVVGESPTSDFRTQTSNGSIVQFGRTATFGGLIAGSSPGDPMPIKIWRL